MRQTSIVEVSHPGPRFIFTTIDSPLTFRHFDWGSAHELTWTSRLVNNESMPHIDGKYHNCNDRGVIRDYRGVLTVFVCMNHSLISWYMWWRFWRPEIDNHKSGWIGIPTKKVLQISIFPNLKTWTVYEQNRRSYSPQVTVPSDTVHHGVFFFSSPLSFKVKFTGPLNQLENTRLGWHLITKVYFITNNPHDHDKPLEGMHYGMYQVPSLDCCIKPTELD